MWGVQACDIAMRIALVVLVATACGGQPSGSLAPREAAKAAERKLNSAEQELLENQGFAILGNAETTSFTSVTRRCSSSTSRST